MGADAESYREGIARCAVLPGGCEWAMLLLDEMAAVGVAPSADCYARALHAAVSAQRSATIEQLIADSRARGVELATQDVCAGLSVVRAAAATRDAFAKSKCGRLWHDVVLPSLLGDGETALALNGCSANLAAEATSSALEALVARQLEAGHGHSVVRRALRLTFGAGEFPAKYVKGGSDTPPRASESDASAAVEALLGAAQPSLRCARERVSDGGVVGEVFDLVVSQASLEAWIRARCVSIWLADTGRAAAEPTGSNFSPSMMVPKPTSALLRGGQDAVSPSSSVGEVRGVGPKRKAQLEGAGLSTIAQLAGLRDGDVLIVVQQSEIPAAMLRKYVLEARQMLQVGRTTGT
jgi:predicted flap endonuclease-1-like 5' DNA nuclease